MNDLAPDVVATSIEHALSRIPDVVGRRLLPEVELATRLNIGRYHLRQAVDRLVEAGILVRRRGSGTYVRRVPRPGEPSPDELVSTVKPTDLLAEDATTKKSDRLRPTRAQKQLLLGFWHDWHLHDEAFSQLVVSGMVRRAQEMGHRVLVNALVTTHGPMSFEQLQGELAENPCDGHIVSGGWAQTFLEALDAHDAPVLVQSNSGPINHPLLVRFDIAEAMERATRLLVNHGFERIAFVGYQGVEGWTGDLFQRSSRRYLEVLDEAGLAYRRVESATPQLRRIFELAERLFGEDADRPDALCVMDDVVMSRLAEVLEMRDLVPGRDFGVITHNNAASSNDLSERGFSCMSFHCGLFGQLMIDSLVRVIESAVAPQAPITLHAIWQPGDTHQCTATSPSRGSTRKQR